MKMIIIIKYSFSLIQFILKKSLIKQENLTNFFNNWDQLSQVIGIVISIPSIFIISLIVLRKIRKIISTDIDKATIGIILDKFFGIIWGFLFSYILLSTLLIFIQNYMIFNDLLYFFINNSTILNQINELNNNIIIPNISILNINNEIEIN